MKKYYGILFIFILILNACRQDTSVVAEEILPARNKQVKMKDMFGVNGFEWDFYDAHYNFDTAKYNLIKTFSGFRHFLDWYRIEPEKGVFRFNHKPEGGWSYDEIYQKCYQDSIDVLIDLQTTPDWITNTYPEPKRQRDLLPINYKASRTSPASYIEIAKAGFQIAARYGRNRSVPKKLVMVPKEIDDPVIGLGYIKYVECTNEPDKWWRGKDSEASPEEYAALLSAFYDGHMGKLGKGVGVKAADPTMKVVMGGLAKPNVEFVKRMVEWCKQNRGTDKNGEINLCFDVINYHMYSNDYTGWFASFRSKGRGVAPETNDMTKIAGSFTDYVKTLGREIPVWSTETGYDLSEKSVQRAMPIGNKSIEVTQADWILRLGLLYARLGIDRLFFYQLYDNNDPGTDTGTPFGFSGLVSKNKKRPAAQYIHQVTKLMGDYTYYNTIHTDPIVDVYQKGKDRVFVLLVPDEIDRKEKYSLNLGPVKKATVYRLNPDSDHMNTEVVNVDNGLLELEVTETPIFVIAK